MRRITATQISIFFSFYFTAILLTLLACFLTYKWIPANEFRGIIVFVLGLLYYYSASISIYRLFLFLLPLEEGELTPGSRGELIAQINILFYLIIFNTLIRTNAIPVPLLKMIYIGLGTKFGANSYSAGALLDPPLTEIGENTIVGHNAVIFSHAIEGNHFALAKVVLGNNVTIGAYAIIMADVKIDNGAIVSAGSVVKKGSRIGANEIWGGVPAKLIRLKDTNQSSGS